MVDVNLSTVGQIPSRFLQFISSTSDTVAHMDPTHQFADSITFNILPVSGQPEHHVQIYCSNGSHTGKYLVVKSDNTVIAGSTSDGDTVFLRQTIGTNGPITLSYPHDVPAYYVCFNEVSREAQLEAELTDRCKLDVVDPNFRQGVPQECDGLADELDLSEGAPAQKEAECSVE